MFAKHFSSAHVIAIVALFVALGGTAFAAATLPRDTVGAPQIRVDAVRSPEIKKDAVRSTEIKKDAVRASEIRDQSIGFGDVATAAATKLRGDLLFAKDDNESELNVPFCNSVDLGVCPNFLALELGSGATAPDSNWLIQAKADVQGGQSSGSDSHRNVCGLVDTERTGPNSVLDQVSLRADPNVIEEAISLSAVVKKSAGNPTIALRCSALGSGPPPGGFPRDEIAPTFVKIIALQVGDVTGP